MITSVGYMGSVSDSEWAVVAPHLGMRCWVGGAEDLAPSVISASARQVQVAAGTAGGSGVMDVLDASESVTLAPLASGSRVDVVVLRRSWTPAGTPTGTTAVAVVSGQSLSAALAALRRSPGTVEGADQPAAAFAVAASGGSAAVSLLEYLRVWAANGGMVAASAAVLPTLDEVGTTVRIGADTWTRVPGQGGPSWSRTVQHLVVPGTALFGGAPPAGAQFVVQAGTVAQSSDQEANARITWPQAFPNGLLSVVLTNGDDQACGGSTTVSGQTGVWGAEATGNRTGVVYKVKDSAGGWLRNTRHRVNFVAIGW